MLESLQNLLVDGLVCLGKIFSSLGMSDDHILHACIHQHCGRNLACIGTLLLKVHVLGTDMDIGAFCSLHCGNDVNGRYAEYYIHIIIYYKGF